MSKPAKLSDLLDSVMPKPLDEEIDKAIADSSNAIAVDFATGIIVLAKTPAELLFGYQPGELKGKSIHDLVPERVREMHKYWFEQYRLAPMGRAMGSRGMELRGLHKDGHEFPVEIGLTAVDLGELKLAIATVIPMARRG